MKKNLKSKWLLFLPLAMGAFGVTACSDDYEPWELLETTVTSTIPEKEYSSEKVPWNGGTFSINVKTNGSWNIEVPAWLSVDKSEGYGDATIEATIARTSVVEECNREIIVKTTGSESSNVAGRNEKKIEFKQEGLEKGIQITDCTATFTKQLTDDYDYYQCGYKITYNINNELTDEEFNDMVNEVYLYTYINTSFYCEISGGEYKYNLNKTDLTKGTHVLENNECWSIRNKNGAYLNLRQISIAIKTKNGIKVIYSTRDIEK